MKVLSYLFSTSFFFYSLPVEFSLVFSTNTASVAVHLYGVCTIVFSQKQKCAKWKSFSWYIMWLESVKVHVLVTVSVLLIHCINIYLKYLQ